jgi:hypothetical protein
MLITGERHLRLVLGGYADHYNLHGPHRALQQAPPAGRPIPSAPGANARVLCRDRLGGLIHEYPQVAWSDIIFGTHRRAGTRILPLTYATSQQRKSLTSDDDDGRRALARPDRREPNGICWPGVGAKTSEVPMAAGMLSRVNLNGKIVTADALHTVTATAEFICGQGPPGQGEHAVSTIDAAGGQAADLRAGCGVQRAGSLVSSPETRRFMRWMPGPRYFDEPERLHLAGGGAQQPCRQAGDRDGQCGCRGDDREVDQR